MFTCNCMYNWKFSTLNEAGVSQITSPISPRLVNSHHSQITFPRKKWSSFTRRWWLYDCMLIWWWRMGPQWAGYAVSPEKWRKSYNPQIVTLHNRLPTHHTTVHVTTTYMCITLKIVTHDTSHFHLHTVQSCSEVIRIPGPKGQVAYFPRCGDVLWYSSECSKQLWWSTAVSAGCTAQQCWGQVGVSHILLTHRGIPYIKILLTRIIVTIIPD